MLLSPYDRAAAEDCEQSKQAGDREYFQ